MNFKFLVILLLTSQIFAEPLIHNITTSEFDRVEAAYFSKRVKETLKNGVPTKEFNQELADIAQKEADRLASLQKLEYPTADLSAKKYYGFSREMIGKVQINNCIVIYSFC